MGASNRNYNLSVELCVTFRIGRDCDIEVLQRQIYVVDELQPWVTLCADGSSARSIHWMSTPRMVEGNGVDRLYFVEVRPPFLCSFDQAKAYEKYGETLAKNLVQVLPSDVLSVKSRLIVQGVYSESYRPTNQ
ncbi:MAG: hypothetical protein ABWX90_03400 [Candidatus Saccharimonadales bacterium]